MSGGFKGWLTGKNTDGEKLAEGSYTDYLDSLLSTVIEIASASDIQFTVFCDDLDNNFGSEFYSSSCESLINATVSLNRLFRKAGAKIKIVLLLRSDIFHSLSFSDLSKYKKDHAVVLDWRPELKENSPLVSLILRKVVRSLGVDYPENLATIFPHLFPYPIDNSHPATYFINMTMGRPRDVVSLLKSAIDHCPRDNFFSPRLFRESKLAYSRDFLLDIKSEMNGHLNKEQAENCFMLINNLGKNTFSMGDIIDKRARLIEELGGESALKKAIQFLFRFGVVGNIFHDPESPSTVNTYSWAFREDILEPDFDSRFTVHLGLRAALKAEKQKRVFEQK